MKPSSRGKDRYEGSDYSSPDDGARKKAGNSHSGGGADGFVKWLADTGTIDHVTSDSTGMYNCRTAPPGTPVVIADDGNFQWRYTGTWISFCVSLVDNRPSR